MPPQKKLGMENTQYYNASGAAASSFEGLYQPEGFDLNGDNVSTARDISILIYHMLDKYPEVLNYTKNPEVTVKKGTPYEETFESYVLSIEGNTYSFKGMDGLKTGSSPSAAFGYGATAERDNTRLIQVILVVGTWEEENGEDIRFPIGNALLDKLFTDYNRQKILSKGSQIINDREIYLTDDLYALLKPEQEFSFDFTDKGISVKTDNEGVSSKIIGHPVAFRDEKGKGLTLPKDLFQSKENFFEELKTNKLLPILMGLIGLLIITISRILVSIRHRKGYRGNILTTLGIIIGCVIIVSAIYLTLEQLMGSFFV